MRLAIAIAILATAANAATVWVDANNQPIARPDRIGQTMYPTDAQLAAHGYRETYAPEIEQRFWEWDGTGYVAMSQQDIDAILAADEAAATQAETDRQAAKPRALRKAENAFYELTYAIYGDMTKRGFDVLGATLDAMSQVPETAMQAIVLSLRLLAVDAQAKREGGNYWWDDAIYHGPLED